MHYKAVGALAVAGVLALSLAACSNDTGSGGGGADGKTTITWASVSSDKIAVEKVAKDFMAENPDIEVKTIITDVDNYQTTLRTQLSSGTAPDVFFTWAGDGNPMAMKVVQAAGLILDLSDRPWVKEIPDGLKPVTQIDGKTYIAPISYSGIGAAYNTNAMTENGFKVPTTWTEVLQLCTDAKAKGKTAFALAAGTPWNTQLIPYALTPTLVYGPNPDFASQMSQGKVTFADSDWKVAFDKYKEMADKGCFQDGYLGTVYEDALSMVSKGDAMASVQVNSSMAAILQAAPDGTKLDLQPLPATDDASATRMAGAAGASYGINAATKHKDAALKLVDYMASDEGLTAYADAAAAIPAIPAPSYKVDPSLETFVKYQSEGKTDPYMDQLWPNAKVQQVHFEVLQQLLAGSLSSTDALKEMDSAYAEGE